MPCTCSCRGQRIRLLALRRLLDAAVATRHDLSTLGMDLLLYQFAARLQPLPDVCSAPVQTHPALQNTPEPALCQVPSLPPIARPRAHIYEGVEVALCSIADLIRRALNSASSCLCTQSAGGGVAGSMMQLDVTLDSLLTEHRSVVMHEPDSMPIAQS